MISFTSLTLAVLTATFYLLAYVFMAQWLAFVGNFLFFTFLFSALDDIIEVWRDK